MNRFSVLEAGRDRWMASRILDFIQLMLNEISGLKTFSLVIFVQVLLEISFSDPSYADVTNYYVRWSCDSAHRSLTIENSAVFDDARTPPRSILLSEVGVGSPPNRPIEVCNLGQRRVVSLRGFVNDDHSRDDHLDIYIGMRPPISIYETNITIKIRYIQKDFFVSIKKCENPKKCSIVKFTNPSFKCGVSNTYIESLICYYDRLSELDISLSNTWHNYFNQIKSLVNCQNIVVQEERHWLKTRGLVCDVPDSDQVSSTVSPDAIEHCLEGVYEARIRQLNERAHSAQIDHSCH